MRYINDNGEFWDGGSIVIGDRRYLSPSEDILEQAGYHPYTPPEPTAAELLEQARSAKVMDIEEYDNSNHVNVFYLAGQPLWLDAATRQQLRTSIDAYVATGAETVTKWFGGQQFTFHTQVWLAMLNALEVYAAEALNVTESHKAAVMALTSVADVESYDYTVGYPTALNFNEQWMRSLS